MVGEYINLHCHTKQTEQDSNKNKSDSGAYVRECESPEQFLNIVEKCKMCVVAITNHNIFDRVQYNEYNKKLKESKINTVLLPGIEINISISNIYSHSRNVKRKYDNLHFIVVGDNTKINDFERFVELYKSKLKPNTLTLELDEFLDVLRDMNNDDAFEPIITIHWCKGDKNSIKDISEFKEILYHFNEKGLKNIGDLLCCDAANIHKVSKDCELDKNKELKFIVSPDNMGWELKNFYAGPDQQHEINDADIQYEKLKMSYVQGGISSFEKLKEHIKNNTGWLFQPKNFIPISFQEKVDSDNSTNKTSFLIYKGGLNIIFGEKGSGKTQLLKNIYNQLTTDLNNSKTPLKKIYCYNMEDIDKRNINDKLDFSFENIVKIQMSEISKYNAELKNNFNYLSEKYKKLEDEYFKSDDEDSNKKTISSYVKTLIINNKTLSENCFLQFTGKKSINKDLEKYMSLITEINKNKSIRNSLDFFKKIQANLTKEFWNTIKPLLISSLKEKNGDFFSINYLDKNKDHFREILFPEKKYIDDINDMFQTWWKKYNDKLEVTKEIFDFVSKYFFIYKSERLKNFQFVTKSNKLINYFDTVTNWKKLGLISNHLTLFLHCALMRSRKVTDGSQSLLKKLQKYLEPNNSKKVNTKNKILEMKNLFNKIFIDVNNSEFDDEKFYGIEILDELADNSTGKPKIARLIEPSTGQKSFLEIQEIFNNQSWEYCLMDEPERGLDFKTTRHLIQELIDDKLRKQDVDNPKYTIIIASHNSNLNVLSNSIKTNILTVWNYKTDKYEKYIRYPFQEDKMYLLDNGTPKEESFIQKSLDILEGGKDFFVSRNNKYSKKEDNYDKE